MQIGIESDWATNEMQEQKDPRAIWNIINIVILLNLIYTLNMQTFIILFMLDAAYVKHREEVDGV